MIAGIHHFLTDPTPLAPAALHPLLAQPLLELCLRIPSWLWVSGGRDRAVAREAFRGLVPDAILDRRGKGTLESMFMKGYMNERPRLERFLAQGELAQRGIIDGSAVSVYLRRDGEPRDFGYVRILEIAAAEQWLRSFGG
jgi:asparagine synthase (glutamine-hydrolysing)